jgi:hypothetical protein
MAHEYNDADWEYEIDSAQRQGTTGQTRNRRHGEVSCPEPTDGKAPNNQHKEGSEAFDRSGIPTGI